MPAVKDDEGLDIIITTFEKSKSSLPTFINFDSSPHRYIINPVISDIAGLYTIQVDLTDSMGASKSHTFDVKVIET